MCVWRRENARENNQTSKLFKFHNMREREFHKIRINMCRERIIPPLEGVCLFKRCDLFRKNFVPLERIP